MRRSHTNSWLAALIAFALGVGAYLLAGWIGVLIFFVAFCYGGIGTIWNGLRADGIRPRAEWSDRPVPPRDWVI